MSGDARRVLLGRLIDHAALFPPASLGMGGALEADRRARETPEAWMLGRFVVPASRLPELTAAVGPARAPRLSVVLDGAAGAAPDRWQPALQRDLRAVARAARSGLPVELVEVRLPGAALGADALAAARERVGEALGGAVTPFFELPLGEGFEGTVAAMGEAGAAAKVRCGGLEADAFPSVEALAAFVAACRDADVPFKATAGLHHPIRHPDPATGFVMHGFLNLLAAAALAEAEGLAAGELAAVLAEEDAAAFEVTAEGLAVHGFGAGEAAIARVRERRLVGYGSCSFAEPVEDLRALGILSD